MVLHILSRSPELKLVSGLAATLDIYLRPFITSYIL
jgi:hypothetical protein